MLSIETKKQFIKDWKLLERRGLDYEKLREVIVLLASGTDLPASCRPYRLVGNWSSHWECHIAPDWLLIYQKDDKNLILVRTGSHSDLF
jgi:mRNA interferase YafQ